MALHTSPFSSTTGKLLPHYRESYLRGQLSPEAAQEVETYLRNSPVQTRLTLANWHKLVADETEAGRLVPEPPAWIRKQLRKQPTVSKVGPLRRPAFQLAGLMLVGLGVTSGVQWVRQKPLVPEPVTAAVQQMTRSVGEATKNIAASFDSEETRREKEETRRQEEAEQRELELAKLQQERAFRAARYAASTRKRPVAVEPITVAAPRSINMALNEVDPNDTTQAQPQPEAQATASSVSGTTVVRGRIMDDQGNPLAGATVLVQGTQQGTSTDANGKYTIEVPASSILQFGYAGYVDQVRQTATDSADVILEPAPEKPEPTRTTTSRKNRQLRFR